MQIVGFFITNNSEKCKEVNVTIDKKTVLKATILTATTCATLAPVPAQAVSISQSVEPVIEILKDLAEPVSYGFMIKGFMKLMAGQEHEGLKIIKCSICGYIGIQWIPMIFSIIKSIKF